MKYILALTALMLAPLAALSATESKLRNIVLILADDMGNDMSGLGTPGLATPNLDQLARDGVLFTRAFSAAAVCSPSRAAISFRAGGHLLAAEDWDAILDFADLHLRQRAITRSFNQLPAANLLH